MLALTHANLFDGTGAPSRRNATILIQGRHILAIRDARSALPRGASVIDLKGAWVLPGLIDAHVHFRDAESPTRALRLGVTTARSLGVDRFIDVELARRHAAGDRHIPDVIAAGYHVRPRLAEAFFSDFPALSLLRPGLVRPDDAVAAVRANAGRRVAWIKVMATERAGSVDSDFRRRALDDAQLSAAVAEALRLGLPVAAHAHTDDGARAAVAAGARTVEHGTLLALPTMRMMRSRRTCLVPTLSFWADMGAPGGEYDAPALAAKAREMAPQAARATRLAWKAGVRVIAGSDMRYDRTSPLAIADEILLLHASGMPPAAALRSATSDAASCLGVANRTGALRPGLEADILVVDKDPRRDLSTLKTPRLIINDGAVIR